MQNIELSKAATPKKKHNFARYTQQEHFSKYMANVEKMRTKYETLKDGLERLAPIVSKEFAKPIAKFTALRMKYIKTFDKHFDKKSLSRHQKETISYIIRSLLDSLRSHEAFDASLYVKHSEREALHETRKTVLREFFTNECRHEAERIHELGDEELEQMLGQLPKTQQKDFEACLKEAIEELEEAEKPKTAVELFFRAIYGDEAQKYIDEFEYPEVVELEEDPILADFNQIYRNLSKRLHPDLEQDETLRLQKQEKMKLLTRARHNNDFYHLLKMQVELDALEGIETISLEEEQLIRINEMLRKEATAIYLQIDDLQCKSELSQVYKLFYSKSERVVKQKIAAEHINLQSAIETLEQELEKISTLAKAKAYISNVKIVKAQTQESILGQLLKAVFTP